MSVADLCIYFIIGILSIGYPILLQVISHLDEKYSSIIIVDLFKKELRWRLFNIFFISSLILVAVYALITLYKLNECLFINLFTTYLLLVSTSLLVLTFLMFVGRIITYYTPSKIVTYFIQKENPADYEYFRALGDILYFSVEQNKDAFAKVIHEHFTALFSDFRSENTGAQVIYPASYYELVINTVARLAPLKERRFGFLEHLTVGGVWLIGDEVEISEGTFGCLWRCLTIAVNFDRDDMVMQYWPIAHNHFISKLDFVRPEYVQDNGVSTIVNQAAINHRNELRTRFWEFNQALIGLLLYRGRWDCIKRTFRYVTNSPPKYVLLPEYMDEVFGVFFGFWDAGHYNFPFISVRYWYPETEGINSEELVKYWTSKTAALLFLRQYSIIEYYTYMRPLAYPALPQKKAKKREWIENLNHFKRMIEDLYQNRELMNAVGLGFLDDAWCETNHKIKPIDFIANVIESVTGAYERGDIEQTVADDELIKFKEASTRIIQTTLQPYLDLFSNTIAEPYTGYAIPGIRGILEKSPFAEDTDADSANHGSIFAQSLSQSIKQGIYNYLNFIPRNTLYRLAPEDIFPAIDILNLDAEQDVIFNFGIDFSFFNRGQPIEGLQADNYKGIRIHELPFYGTGYERRLYVLQKSDYPYVFLKDIPDDEVQKYHLERLDPINAYAAIIDLYRNEDIKTEVLADEEFAQEDKNEIDKRVLIYITFKIIIRLKENMRSVSLMPYYPYYPEGMTQTPLADVTQFRQTSTNDNPGEDNEAVPPQ